VIVEKLDRYTEKDVPEEDKSMLADARQICDEVIGRMEETAKKYQSAYTLADITAELDAELLDIVGWPLLEIIRMRRIMTKRLERLDGEYLKKFLSYHDRAYLERLRDSIEEELLERRNHGQ